GRRSCRSFAPSYRPTSLECSAAGSPPCARGIKRRVCQRKRTEPMKLIRLMLAASPLLAVTLSGCGPESGDPAESSTAPPPASSPIEHTLVPLPGMEDAVPTITRAERVLLQTTAGEVTIEVYPEAAPNAARRFLELVESGFYDATPVSRVVPGFVAQFGINWREPHRQWQNRNFDDDPTL